MFHMYTYYLKVVMTGGIGKLYRENERRHSEDLSFNEKLWKLGTSEVISQEQEHY